eukprot:466117_1
MSVSVKNRIQIFEAGELVDYQTTPQKSTTLSSNESREASSNTPDMHMVPDITPSVPLLSKIKNMFTSDKTPVSTQHTINALELESTEIIPVRPTSVEIQNVESVSPKSDITLAMTPVVTPVIVPVVSQAVTPVVSHVIIPVVTPVMTPTNTSKPTQHTPLVPTPKSSETGTLIPTPVDQTAPTVQSLRKSQSETAIQNRQVMSGVNVSDNTIWEGEIQSGNVWKPASQKGSDSDRSGDSDHDGSHRPVLERLRGHSRNVSCPDMSNGHSFLRRTSISVNEDVERTPLRLLEITDCVPGKRKKTVIKRVHTRKIMKSRALGGETQLLWETRPHTVFLIKKHFDSEATEGLRTIGAWLKSQGLRVLVEPQVQREELPEFTAVSPDNPSKGVDFCVCLGGDGTLLHLNSLFDHKSIPPVISFAFGSLGFLTPFEFSDWEKILQHILQGDQIPIKITLRMRLVCEIYRKNNMSTPERSNTVLNEILVDRGHHPYLSSMDLFIDGEQITSIQADGVIISTPTGSTAYSMSAGGSMAVPSLSATLITPICPHTLSFRPLIAPDSSVIEISVPEAARSSVCVSFDGRDRTELFQGDSLVIYSSETPLPSIKMKDFNQEWFRAIQQKLHWNLREQQKPLSEKQQTALSHRSNM